MGNCLSPEAGGVRQRRGAGADRARKWAATGIVALPPGTKEIPQARVTEGRGFWGPTAAAATQANARRPPLDPPPNPPPVPPSQAVFDLGPAVKVLDATGCGLAVLPPEIARLSNLTRLNVVGPRGGTLSLPRQSQPTVSYLQRRGRRAALGAPSAGTPCGRARPHAPTQRPTPPPRPALRQANNGLASLPPTLGALTALRTLVLDGNALTSLPGAEADWAPLSARLETLSLARNRLAYVPPALGRLGALKSLNLSSNRQLAALPDELGGCSALEALDVSGCPEIAALPEGLGRLARLKTLNADGTGVAAVPSALLLGCGALHTLSLHGCEGAGTVEGLGGAGGGGLWTGSGRQGRGRGAAAAGGCRKPPALRLPNPAPIAPANAAPAAARSPPRGSRPRRATPSTRAAAAASSRR
jgi:hypothetical protein